MNQKLLDRQEVRTISHYSICIVNRVPNNEQPTTNNEQRFLWYEVTSSQDNIGVRVFKTLSECIDFINNKIKVNNHITH